MRSGWVQLGAWTAATGAAVALSWLGVHAVLADTEFEGPVALPLPATGPPQPGPAATPPPASTTGDPPSAPGPGPTGGPGGSGAPGSSGTASAPHPGPDPSADPAPSATRSQAGPSHGSASIQSTPSSTTGTVRSYLMPGGRVALDIRQHDVQLVSATPEAGWTMQVWHGDQWMRINFSRDGRVSSVWVTWNGFEPNVQVDPG
ncbi:hypothetical protein ACFV4P_26570 [Kitasatospora sp. NPDC059795]|uniref:hypothetical protein n=1 Tax=Kitasatospora sp. NPDC059795 TaxID=3346949 RepID=UPI003659DAE2